MLCRIYINLRRVIKSRSFHQEYKKGSSFAFLHEHDGDQFGRRIFVRMCNNFRMRRILSPVYSRSLTTASWDTCTFVSARSLLFRWSVVFLFMLYVCFTDGTRNAGKLQEFVNIESPTLNRKSRRFSLELYECYYYYRGHASNFRFRWLTFYTYV